MRSRIVLPAIAAVAVIVGTVVPAAVSAPPRANVCAFTKKQARRYIHAAERRGTKAIKAAAVADAHCPRVHSSAVIADPYTSPYAQAVLQSGDNTLITAFWQSGGSQSGSSTGTLADPTTITLDTASVHSTRTRAASTGCAGAGDGLWGPSLASWWKWTAADGTVIWQEYKTIQTWCFDWDAHPYNTWPGGAIYSVYKWGHRYWINPYGRGFCWNGKTVAHGPDSSWFWVTDPEAPGNHTVWAHGATWGVPSVYLAGICTPTVIGFVNAALRITGAMVNGPSAYWDAQYDYRRRCSGIC